jgi:hypothetical protein
MLVMASMIYRRQTAFSGRPLLLPPVENLSTSRHLYVPALVVVLVR